MSGGGRFWSRVMRLSLSAGPFFPPLPPLVAAMLLLAGCGGGATEALPVPTPEAQDPRAAALIGKALLPDLMTQIPDDLYVERLGGEYRLRLTNEYTNVGQGPLHLRGETVGTETHAIQHILDASGAAVHTENVSQFEWHESHGHWHIDHVSRYQLLKGSPDGPVVAEAEKVTFCMIDLSHRYPDMRDTPEYGDYFGCNGEYQGLSVGWSDIYSAGLPDQWVVVTGLPRGIYYLLSTVNPERTFIERDGVGETPYANNAAWVKIRLDPAKQQVTVLDSGLGSPQRNIRR